MSRDKERNQWRARITFKHRMIQLGRFEAEEEAARAYDAKAKELFGEFAWLNFPARLGDRRRKLLNYLEKRLINRLRFAGKVQWFANFFA